MRLHCPKCGHDYFANESTAPCPACDDEGDCHYFEQPDFSEKRLKEYEAAMSRLLRDRKACTL